MGGELRKRLCCAGGLLAALLVLPSSLPAAETYVSVALDRLKITKGKLPAEPKSADWRTWRRRRLVRPHVVLDGKGEAYVAAYGVGRFRGRAVARTPGVRAGAVRESLVLHVLAGKAVTGTLYLPKADWSGLAKLRFKIPATEDKKQEPARKEFLTAKIAHYRYLLQLRIPGRAWFRHQLRVGERELSGKSAGTPTTARIRRRPRVTTWEHTYGMFTGGRAVSENLQLDRLLPASRTTGEMVTVSSLEGITVKEMDWISLLKKEETKLDPTAAHIPADQYAVFFPDFAALLTLIDEADRDGTPILELLQKTGEDAQSQQRYERQLCLDTSTLSRLLGGTLIKSVAVTGSDPFFRTGTDLTILFEARNPTALKTVIREKQLAALKATPGARKVEAVTDGLSYSGVVSPGRAVSSHMAVIGSMVIVTNSPAQIRRLAAIKQGTSKSLASLPEYRFFRQRYRRGDDGETAFLIVTDAAIRKWGGPRWRIAASRRTRAAAILAEFQATYLDQLARGTVEPGIIYTDWQVPDLGKLRLSSRGVTSATYGSLDFLTPISELSIDKVTAAEAASYRRWRRGYQRNWTQFFDPLAVRFSVRKQRLFADVSVMPLIAGSKYREYIRVASGAKIKPQAGDRHKGALFHFALAVNLKSQTARQADSTLRALTRSLGKTTALGWMGESVAVYAEKDPFWAELAKANEQNKWQFLIQNIHRLPVVARAEVSNSLKLALFLTGVRTTIEQSAPGLTGWETLTWHKQPYVKITPTDQARRSAGDRLNKEFAIYYAATPRSLIVTLREDLLKQAIDRERAAVQAQKEKKPLPVSTPPWLGSSVAVQMDRDVLKFFEMLESKEYQAEAQARAWAAIPILNEWKRRYPKQDPVKFHQRFWQTTLHDGGGGTYVWNKAFQTMESTRYGYPGEPKQGPIWPAALRAVRALNFGITFEHNGLRAKAVIERSGTK